MFPELTQEEVFRYSRHLMIPDVGLEGQRKLKAARVLIVGTGGLGSPVSLYLAAAGIGRIGVIDYDIVDSSNLQRQVIHGSSKIGKPKVISAKERMLDLNPYIQVDDYSEVFCSDNALRIAENYDILVDGTDNFPTRYLVNDLCVMTHKPYIYGSIFRFEGQVSVFDASTGPCYRCLFPDPPPFGLIPSCAESGVFGVLPGTIGTLQATETIKVILGIGTSLSGKLLLYDALELSFQSINLRKNPRCKVCSPNPEITHLIDYDEFCGTPAHDRQQEQEMTLWDIEPVELAERLKHGDSIRLLDVREAVEQQVSRLEGAELFSFGELASRLNELDQEQEIVLFCRTGVRSRRALQILVNAGFKKVKNLHGGINAWSQQVDPTMLQY
jgi:adenylyltransferase/sulfurtransferase